MYTCKTGQGKATYTDMGRKRRSRKEDQSDIGECPLCVQKVVRMVSVPCCGYKVCGQCLTTHFHTQVDSGVLALSCPNCDGLCTRHILNTYLTPKYRHRYERYLNVANSDGNSLQKTCPQCTTVYSTVGQQEHTSGYQQQVKSYLTLLIN